MSDKGHHHKTMTRVNGFAYFFFLRRSNSDGAPNAPVKLRQSTDAASLSILEFTASEQNRNSNFIDKFPVTNKAQWLLFDEHTRKHLEMNRTKSNSTIKCHDRQWYCTFSDWLRVSIWNQTSSNIENKEQLSSTWKNISVSLPTMKNLVQTKTMH